MTEQPMKEAGPARQVQDRRCAVVAAGIEPGPLLDALRSVPHTRVGDICIFPSNGRGEPDADYLILAANDGSRFHSLEDQIDRWSGRSTRVLLAVPESKCAMMGELPRRADGLILLGQGLRYLEQSLKLAEDGYSIMPTARSEGGDGAGYLNMLKRLGQSERAILRLLAEGDSNRSIAEALGESEARVKSMVRAILIKLDCRNRTEAAVLAATTLLPLLDSLPAELAGDLDIDDDEVDDEGVDGGIGTA